MGTYRALYLSLAAFLLVPGQVRAQDKEAPPLKMVYAVWKDQGGAANTMKQMVMLSITMTAPRLK